MKVLRLLLFFLVLNAILCFGTFVLTGNLLFFACIYVNAATALYAHAALRGK